MAVINKLKLLEIANRIALFKALSPHERNMIISMPDIVHVIEATTEFIRLGEYSEYLYIILSGTATVYRGRNKIAQIGGGNFVGEVGFICRKARTASVIANEQLITLKISSSNFSRLPSSLREQIKDRLIGGLVNRVEGLNDDVINLNDELTKIQDEDQLQNQDDRGKEPISESEKDAKKEALLELEKTKKSVQNSTWQQHFGQKKKR
jgi:CRP/FNR family cyclic AMP-dependent transcriptional regulator